MIIGTLKALIAAYVGRDSVDDLVLNGVDTALAALNSARKKAERMHDFEYSDTDAGIVFADATGASLDDAVVYGTSASIKIKRIKGVRLPLSNGDFVPIEFMQSEEWADRVQQQIGRAAYDSTKTLAQLGLSQVNPVCVQGGRAIAIVPSSQITFPKTVWLEVVRYMPDYTADDDEDFFCEFGHDYLLFASVLELNKYWRRFVPKQESNVDEAAVESLAKEALISLLEWDKGISLDTSSRPPKED